MKKQNGQTARIHHSAVLEDFLSLGSPEELARTETRMTLAVKIQDAMTAKGIGKKQFAHMMGQNPSVITKWLSGGQNFTVDTLTDIQRVLGVQLLALEEKTAVQTIYRATLTTVALAQSDETYHLTAQPYNLPSAKMQTIRVSENQLRRQSA